MVIRVDQMRMERHHDSQRSGRLAMTFGDQNVLKALDALDCLSRVCKAYPDRVLNGCR